jgi:hypothetical protein
VEGSCEHGDEPSGSLKYWEVPEWLHNWQLLRKGSAPQVSKYRLLLFREIIAVYCGNHKQHTNTFCGHNAES